MAEQGWNDPVDPKYFKFVEGMKAIAADEKSRLHHRWDPQGGKWWLFEAKKWILEDVGIPDTSPSYALTDLSFGLGAPDWRLNEYSLPDLFRQLSAAFETHKSRFPNNWLVWGPWGGGDWRIGWERPASGMVVEESKGTEDGISEECKKRIGWVRDSVRRGYITHDVGQKMIDDIVAQCT